LATMNVSCGSSLDLLPLEGRSSRQSSRLPAREDILYVIGASL
jgi:hypothetical protein